MSGYVEVLPPELTGPAHPEWFAARRAGITASEIAAVLGLSPYESPFSLYWRKKGVTGEQPDDPAMRWGRRLEQHIRDEFRERHQNDFMVYGAGLYAHTDRPWQMASPDGLIVDLSSNDWDLAPIAGLECKTTGSWDGWGDDGTDQIPIHIRCQAIWQADVLCVPCVYVPVVNGRTYREYVVEADPQDALVMRCKAQAFLDALNYGTPPDLDGTDATLTTLKQLHPDLDDTEAEVPATLARQWAAACAAEKKAKARKKTAEAKLRDRMGRARVAVHNGQRVATRVVVDVKPYEVGPVHKDYLNPPRETT
jgi:putative phage-type endonuclease